MSGQPSVIYKVTSGTLHINLSFNVSAFHGFTMTSKFSADDADSMSSEAPTNGHRNGRRKLLEKKQQLRKVALPMNRMDVKFSSNKTYLTNLVVASYLPARTWILLPYCPYPSMTNTLSLPIHVPSIAWTKKIWSLLAETSTRSQASVGFSKCCYAVTKDWMVRTIEHRAP